MIEAARRHAEESGLAIAYRAYKRGIETYVNPWAADDPGQPQVTSRIGDGFNLDGKN